MHRFFFQVFFLGILVLSFCSCDQKQPEHVAKESAPPAVPLPHYQSLDPQLVELATHALPFWRDCRDEKPALVLMSFDPFLQPIPTVLRDRARELVLTGTLGDIDRHGGFNRPDPIVMPTQALSAALEADLFSRIYWVFPAKVEPVQLNLATFREQMVKAQFFSEEEAQDLVLSQGTFSGQLRGVPFNAVHYGELPEIELNGPMILHVDLSFFRGLYDDEIKTPLYDLIHQSALQILESGWQPLSLTLSYSTLQGAISLDTRFVLTDLAQVLRDPSLLDGDMPRPWQLRAEALYAADMFTESKKLELYQQAVKLAPQAPTAVYDLFQSHFLARELDKALLALERAVALDPGYGAAYLRLASMALEDGNVEMALALLEKAAAVFPANPFIPLQRADLLLQTGRGEAALVLLEPLLEKNWSPTYHPDIPKTLAEMKKVALNPEPVTEEPRDDTNN
jgi:tetratricopeptide (TPR) repeat protein